jgi:hypothetical protein
MLACDTIVVLMLCKLVLKKNATQAKYVYEGVKLACQI